MFLGVKDPEEIRLMIKAVKTVRGNVEGLDSSESKKSNRSAPPLTPIPEISAKNSSIQAFVAPLDEDETTPRDGKGGEGKGEGVNGINNDKSNPYVSKPVSKASSNANITEAAGGGAPAVSPLVLPVGTL